jgi:hypothetical protein
MSAVAHEDRIDFNAMSAISRDESAAQQRIQRASAARWVWQCFKDIPLVEQTGVAVLNSLTLRGGENVDWKALGKEQPKPITVLKRCVPYPLTNCEYEIPLHEAKRYGMASEELPENELPDNFQGASTPGKGVPHKVETKYAYSCARELSDKYADEYGLVVLEPLTGVEDSSVVQQIFEVVQPVTYKLVNLEVELVDAKNRIANSKLPKDIKEKAEGCRLLMLAGCARALKTARQHHGDFALHVQNASAGRKGSRTTALDHDIFVADQLQVEVPQVVNVTKKSDRTEELLHTLAENVAQPKDDRVTALLLEELREEREERKRLTAQVQAMLAVKPAKEEART